MSWKNSKLKVEGSNNGNGWWIWRWSSDGERLINTIGPFKTKKRADEAKLHLEATGKVA